MCIFVSVCMCFLFVICEFVEESVDSVPNLGAVSEELVMKLSAVFAHIK